eukprot:5582874-Prymnesium_polylepis.1
MAVCLPCSPDSTDRTSMATTASRVAPSAALGAAAPPRASTRCSKVASLRLLEMSISYSRSIHSALCCSGCV